MELWSEQEYGDAVVTAALSGLRQPLATRFVEQPATDVLFYVGDRIELYRPLWGGVWPIYIGSASTVPHVRFTWYNKKLAGNPIVTFDALRIAVVIPAVSGPAAVYGEGILQAVFRPLWCQRFASGFGGNRMGVRELIQEFGLGRHSMV